jgi:hypothetical protein
MKFGKTESEWLRTFRPKGQPHGKGSGGAVPMVVDPLGWINRTLTEEEKTTMLKEGRCFRCGNKGHMSKACPTRPSPSSTPSTSKNKPQHVLRFSPRIVTRFPYIYICDILPVTFSKCQSWWHVTVSTNYIKRDCLSRHSGSSYPT